MNLQTSFLANRFWLWTGIIISLISVAAYTIHSPIDGRDGSTIVGYGLGGFSALMVLYLAWLGIRKRRFASSKGLRRDVVSAHVYLGLSLLVSATLHTGFQFGWNVHTLAYVLMIMVILSGFYGIYVYVRYPTLMTTNRGGETLKGMLEEPTAILL